jgi:hypothetical protein
MEMTDIDINDFIIPGFIFGILVLGILLMKMPKSFYEREAERAKLKKYFLTHDVDNKPVENSEESPEK